MNRTQLACIVLIASAMVLGGLLVTRLQQTGPIENQAYGEMVLDRNSLIIMTARTKDDEEAVFVLEPNSQRLMIFLMDLGKKRLMPAQQIDLNQLFGGGSGNTGGSRGTAPSRYRR